MNINSSDKKTIKNYITAFLSLQGIIAIGLLAIIIIFGTMHLKQFNKSRNKIHEQLSHSHLD